MASLAPGLGFLQLRQEALLSSPDLQLHHFLIPVGLGGVMAPIIPRLQIPQNHIFPNTAHTLGNNIFIPKTALAKPG